MHYRLVLSNLKIVELQFLVIVCNGVSCFVILGDFQRWPQGKKCKKRGARALHPPPPFPSTHTDTHTHSHTPFTLYFKFWRCTSYKNLLNATTISFYFLLFLLTFTSTDIIFHKFLEIHSALSEKKILVTNFPFLTDSLKPLTNPTP